MDGQSESTAFSKKPRAIGESGEVQKLLGERDVHRGSSDAAGTPSGTGNGAAVTAVTAAAVNNDDDHDPTVRAVGGRPMSKRRRMLVTIGLGVVIGSMAASVSLLGPFFFTDALYKHPAPGLTYHASVGLVYSSEKFGEIAAAPFVSRDMPNIGSKYLVMLSSATIGGSLLVFAFVDDVSNWKDFLGLCYAIRIVHGAASITNSLSVMTLLTEVDPNRPGFISAFLLAFTGLGHGAGAILAGGLYDLGGFRLPFLATGFFMLLAAFVVTLVVPSTKAPDAGEYAARKPLERHVSIVTALRYPVVWLMAANLLFANSIFAALETVLGHHLRVRMPMQAFTVGLVLAMRVVTALVTAPVVGALLDRRWDARWLECAGYAVMGVGCLLIAPSAFLHIPLTLWLTVLSFLPIGIGGLTVIIASTFEVMGGLVDRGVGTMLEVRIAAAGITRFSLAVGYGVGPFVASTLAAAFGFQFTLTAFGFVFLALAVFLTIVSKLAGCVERRRSRSAERTDNVAMQPLNPR